MAPVFKFRFQRLLDLRQAHLDALAAERAALHETVRAAEATVESLQGDCLEAIEEQRRARRGGFFALETPYGDHLRHLNGKLADARTSVADLRTRRERLRTRLEELSRECEMLEKHKGQLMEEYREDQIGEEQRQLDMHSIYRHLRPGSSL